jgi:hypothetical protein
MAMAGLLAVLVAPGAAHAGPETGSSSSASVDISLSVAARYGLQASGAGSQGSSLREAGPSQFCIATNGQSTPLPVMLVWPSAGQGPQGDRRQEETAVQLSWCQMSSNPQPMNGPGGPMAFGPFIIRPE